MTTRQSLARGWHSLTVAVPKLAKGTWTVSLAYAGNANYVASSGSGRSIVVKK